ncbi:helix-turn-helix domain-containing protein [Paenibacillus lentus]|uniref:winged helix-turn-helix domain-containing protein n=1 Tax=Paenibacillus lentus TaxID=1338368 RepID=UPI0036691744
MKKEIKMNILLLSHCWTSSWHLTSELLYRKYHVLTITDKSWLQHISTDFIDLVFLYFPRFGQSELEVSLLIREKCQAPIHIIYKNCDIVNLSILTHKNMTLHHDPIAYLMPYPPLQKPNSKDSIIHFQLIQPKRIVIVNSKEIELSHREFEVLQFLYDSKGEIVEREELINSIWGGICSDANVYVTIQKLREKIEDNPRNPKYIVTKRGGGYSLTI